MPRRKAFSAKQKKQQLQERRRRKADGPEYAKDQGTFEVKDIVEGQGEGLSDEVTEVKVTKPVDFNVDRLNEQPQYHPHGRYDPNRYRLHFFKEKDDVLRKRKERSRQQYDTLPEESLELDVDFSEDSLVDIPKRPAWDYSLSKRQLEANEERYFKEYIDNVFSEHEADSLSYFELNLETWRQLWRVLEMSDVFLLITDIRHPLNLETWRQLWPVLEMSDAFLLITDIRHPALHFPPALYKYITETLKKQVILILNKIDLAPPSLVVAWQQYFSSRFPLVKIVCFTSYPKTKEELERVTDKIGKVIFKKRKRRTYRAVGPKELLAVCEELIKDKVDLSSWAKKIDEDLGISESDESSDNEDDDNNGGGGGDKQREKQDCSFEERETYKDGVLTIGCIGYPNVGKSSVLNGLMGKKVVSVSKTPGHTKHFQTIYLTPSVCLCDCPGLVFPSKSDRTLQVLSGIYPISQVREPYSVVQFIAERLDLPKLLHIKHPEDSDHEERTYSWSAMDICDAWAVKKGFLTARASRADTYRAANNILNLAVEGRLCLCFYPPGYIKSKEKLATDQATVDLIKLQDEYRQKLQASVDSDSENSSDSKSEGNQSSDNENTEPASLTSKNPYELLGEND